MKVFKSIIFVLVWLGQIAAEIWAGIHIWNLNMIPLRMFLMGCLVMSLLFIFEGLLFLSGMKSQKGKRPGFFRRLFAWLLIAVTILGCVFGTFFAQKVGSTIDIVTETKTVTSTFSVYVLEDDPAQTLDDAAGYQFGVTTSYDASNSKIAIQQLEDYFDGDLKSEEYESVPEMVKALFEKKADAILLSDAYVPILEDLDEYNSFRADTRVLHEFKVEQKVKTPTTKKSGALPTNNLEPVNDVTSDPFVVYLSGSDTRNEKLTTSNSDVNILVVINPQSKQILLLNTPRDYFIPNPAGRGALDKLTHCGIYGIDCSINALSDLYDVIVNYYGQINFTGFETLIDAIGGITVESETAFTTLNGHYQIKEGMNKLNGAEALGFVRERYAFRTGDNQRGKNQMKVITAVIDKLSAGTIIMHYNSILDSLQGMFVTNFSGSEISDLVRMQLGDGADWNVKSFAVTGPNGSEITYSIPGARVSVMYPDNALVERASALVDRVIAGDVLQDEDVAIDAPSN